MPRVLEKKERSLGLKLSIRGERCLSPKCAFIRKPHRPGQHGKKYRRKLSEFGMQLQEKQKVKFSYGLSEKELRRVFEGAAEKSESVIKNIAEALENRLDNVVMRLGFAESRSIARQLVSHGHILVNGRRVTIPSYRLKVGDVITVRSTSRSNPLFQELPSKLKNYDVPDWLSLDKETPSGKVEALPRNIELPSDINLVVDYYSKK